MNSRDRVTTAINHHQPDRTPKGFFATAESTQALQEFLGVEDQDAVLEKLGVDLRHVEPVFVGPEERAGGLRQTEKPFADFWGVGRKLVSNQFGKYSEIAEHPMAGIKTVAEIETYEWPMQEWFDCSTISEQIEKTNRSEERFINYHRAGKLFEICWALRGMEQCMLDMLTQPELIEAMLKKVIEFYTVLAKRVIQAGAGRIDMVTIGDDIGTQRGMMMSPQLWRSILKPYLKDMIGVFHDLGVKVMYHSCGSILPVIPDLIEIGVDILEPIQTLAEGMVPSFLKDTYGHRLCFHGGVDEQELLPKGTPERIRREVSQLCRVLGEGGGYIMMAAHAFQPDTPCENIVAMYESAEVA